MEPYNFSQCPLIGYAVHSVQLIVAFLILRWSSDQGAKRYTKRAPNTMGREPLAVRSVPFIDSEIFQSSMVVCDTK